MKITKDGDHYLVAADNFINLQESKDYFFISEKEYEAFRARAIQEDREARKKVAKSEITKQIASFQSRISKCQDEGDKRAIESDEINYILTLLEETKI